MNQTASELCVVIAATLERVSGIRMATDCVQFLAARPQFRCTQPLVDKAVRFQQQVEAKLELFESGPDFC